MSESELRKEIATLPATLRGRLEAAGFDIERLVVLARPLWERASAIATPDRDERNRVRGQVQPPGSGDLLDTPAAGSGEEKRLSHLGFDAICRGALALWVLAGGV